MRNLIFFTRIKEDDLSKGLRVIKELEKVGADYDVLDDKIWIDLRTYLCTNRVQDCLKEINNRKYRENLKLKLRNGKDLILTIDRCYCTITYKDPGIFKVFNRIENLDINNTIRFGVFGVTIEGIPMYTTIASKKKDREELIISRKKAALKFLSGLLPEITEKHISWSGI